MLELARPEGASSGTTWPTGKLVLVVIVWAEAERPQPRATANREHFRELFRFIVLIIFEPSFFPRCILSAFIGMSVTRCVRTANRAKAGLCYRRDQESKPVDSLGAEKGFKAWPIGPSRTRRKWLKSAHLRRLPGTLRPRGQHVKARKR